MRQQDGLNTLPILEVTAAAESVLRNHRKDCLTRTMRGIDLIPIQQSRRRKHRRFLPRIHRLLLPAEHRRFLPRIHRLLLPLKHRRFHPRIHPLIHLTEHRRFLPTGHRLLLPRKLPKGMPPNPGAEKIILQNPAPSSLFQTNMTTIHTKLPYSSPLHQFPSRRTCLIPLNPSPIYRLMPRLTR